MRHGGKLAESWIGALSMVLLGGCWGTETTEFPDGLEPLERHDLAAPPGTADDPFPEDYVLEGIEGGGYDTVLGRGYIHAPPQTVWAAFRDPAVGADRRTSPPWSSMPLDDPMYADSYVIHHIVEDIVTVEWDVTWRHGLVEGNDEAPGLVAIRWQKTHGSTLIRLIEGSLLLSPVGDGSVTELELAYHADATASGLPEYRQYMRDMYDDAVALVHGQPLPSF